MNVFQRITFLLLWAWASVASGAAMEFHDIYQWETHGYSCFRIPALCRTGNGVLLAFAEGRKNSWYDFGDIDVVLRRSFDGGKTWGSLQIVWSAGEDTCGNPNPVYDADTGRVWLLMCHNKNIVVDPTYSSGHESVVIDGDREIWVCYSDDDGATWSSPIDISVDVKPPTFSKMIGWDTVGPGRGIQFKSGTHAGRLIVPAFMRNIQSDDHGQSWTYSGAVGGTRMTNEGALAQLDDGRLIRNDRGRSVHAEAQRRLISYSYDDGRHWSPYVAHDQLLDPTCHASMICYQPVGAAESILLFANPASTDSRVDLTLRLSEDGGKSWDHSKLVYPDSAAYSSMEVLADNKIGIMFENGIGWPSIQRISLAIFDEDWLYDSAIAAWSFNEKPIGQVASTAVGALVDERGYGLPGSAEAAFVYVAGSTPESTALDFANTNAGIVITDENIAGVWDFAPQDDFCIQAVFKTVAHGAGDNPGALVAKDRGSGQPQWWIRVENSQVVFNVNDGQVAATLFSSSSVNDGQWHHMLVGRNTGAGALALYVDGTLEDEVFVTFANPIVNEYPVKIGAFNTATTRYFDGQIDEVSIERIAPQAYYRLNADTNDDHMVDMDDLTTLITHWLAR